MQILELKNYAVILLLLLLLLLVKILSPLCRIYIYIYIYIPETNHVANDYNVAAILSLLFMVPISLAPELALMYFYISTFRSMCAVPTIAVFL
jgi:hypothetical protein